jgi:hypothetical protein
MTRILENSPGAQIKVAQGLPQLPRELSKSGDAQELSSAFVQLSRRSQMFCCYCIEGESRQGMSSLEWQILRCDKKISLALAAVILVSPLFAQARLPIMPSLTAERSHVYSQWFVALSCLTSMQCSEVPITSMRGTIAMMLCMHCPAHCFCNRR